MAVADLQAPPEPPDDPISEQPAPPTRGRLPYFPALDGIRAIAVIAVLFFHGGFQWMVGGYLGVSTFFTLSGFLITSLLLAERAQTGGLKMRAFWARRFRRLLPASLAALVLALAFGVFAADATQRANLAGDVVSVLAYVANWRFLFDDRSYADLFSDPSPLLHFWSLAIEEQFYLLYPLVVAAVVGAGARAVRSNDAKREYWGKWASANYRKTLGLVVGGAAVASFLWMLSGIRSPDTVYFSTLTRASELLLGCLLAVILFHAPVTRMLAGNHQVRNGVALAGLAALAVSVLAWITLGQGTEWLYRGGFTLYALVSCTLIAAAILPTGPVRRVLGVAPLRHLGEISYGVYLYHWPVFLWLRQKTDLAIWPRFAVGVAITLVLAELSARLLEMPIRRGGSVLGQSPKRVAPVVMVILAAAAIVVSATAPAPAIDFGATQRGLEQFTTGGDQPPPSIDPAALVAPPPRIAFFGDSTALMTSWGVAATFQRTGEATNVLGVTGLGCSVLRTGERRVAGQVDSSPDFCNDWSTTWLQARTDNQPDISVVQVGPWDIADRKIGGDGVWRKPGDPVFDEFALSEMTAAIDLLTEDGGVVMWLTSPITGPKAVGDDQAGFDAPGRTRIWNDLVRRLPELRPDKVVVVDLAEWMSSLPPGEDERLRPDGVHFTEQTSVEAAEAWVVPAILEAWQDWWVSQRAGDLEAGQDVSVSVVGDGTAGTIAQGLTGWAEAEGGLAVSSSTSTLCGVGRRGNRLTLLNGEETVPEECNGWEESFAALVADRQPQLVVAHFGFWDLTDRQLTGDPTWRSLGDPLFEAFMRNEIGLAMDTLHGKGARVLWLLTPHVDPGRQEDGTPGNHKAADPSRADRLNELIRAEADEREYVTVVDYPAFARAWPGGEFDPAYRQAGLDLTEAGGRSVATWLGPQLLQMVGRGTGGN